MPSKSRSTRRKTLSAADVGASAQEQVAELTGKQVVGVTSVEKTEDGWQVGVEVVEGARVPSTADLLAIYQADLDSGGELQGYKRLKRYVRGAAGEGG